ncbi:hypothetical protein O181_113074 [Austropuccinia psidii MF-1]|uniref:Uncharacterized protein n=1 Tax=Austropuccinia psidii MF-1 TaxID=1389203 RepID=A0A9Q3K2Z0_9BASI|nr:hypothetical protein [Austropuccinia psidii MF-1]
MITSIISASTVNSKRSSTVIITQNNQPEPIFSELINLDTNNTLQKAKNLANRASYYPSRSSQKGYRCEYGRSQSVTEGRGADTATRRRSGHIKSQPEGLQQFIVAQRIPDPCRSVEKLDKLLPDCEKLYGPSQHLQVTQWMASIDGKEKHDSLNGRMEEKQLFTTQESAKNIPSSKQQQFQCEKAATSSEQGQRQSTSYKNLQPGLQNPKYSAGFHGNIFQMAIKMMELQKKEDARLKYQKLFLIL